MIDEQYLTRVLAKLVEQTVEKKVRPAGFVIGRVVSAEPLAVKISDSIELPSSALIVGDQFGTFSAATSDGSHEVVFDNSLKAGDTVQLLSNTGGQQFFVLGRVRYAS